MARFVNVPNLRGVGIHEHEAYCCPIPPSPRRRHRRSSPPLPPNCVGAHSLLLCLNQRSQTYNVWFKLCLCARQGAGKGHGLRHEGTCDFGSSKMPKCLRNFIRTVTFTQCNKCICDAPELGAGTLPNQWGKRWLFLQACVFPMEVSYHLYCDVFLVWEMIKGGDDGTCWAWHVRRALRYCLWRWLHSNLQHCFEKGGCSWYLFAWDCLGGHGLQACLVTFLSDMFGSAHEIF